MADALRFSYATAFDRNIGWVTDWEQQALRFKHVAIAGMGGVGGVHLLALARLGVGIFHIADLDRFDLVNMNRQIGAMMSTLGRPKVDVLAEMAVDVNPEARITRFSNGVTPGTIDAFLDGVDLFVDGFDFFALDIRRQVFAACHARGIPAITAAPIGMGTGMLIFLPGQMSFEQYFRLDGQPEPEQYLRFLMGVAPRGLHTAYLVDSSRVDLAGRRGPSTGAACQLCAGVVATEAVKLLLRRGRVRAAPYHQHFDAYRGKLAVSWLPFGATGPLQRLKRSIARRMLAALAAKGVVQPPPAPAGEIEEILDLARWAPSGDNEQPWTFEIADADTVRVALTINPSNVYEYRHGQPVLLAGGMLLESIRVAASAFGRRMEWRLDPDANIARLIVQLTPDPQIKLDLLCGSLSARSVDRGAYSTRKLTSRERDELATALGAALQISWHEAPFARLRLARLGALATAIRLRMPETFAIHNAVVDWRDGPSATGIPARALGLPASTRALMRWASRDWRRMDRINRLGGALTAGLQMDVVPGLRSAALFTVRRLGAGELGQTETIEAGMALQRFWLTAERLGLSMQPALATLIFADYGARGAAFTSDAGLRGQAKLLAEKLALATHTGIADLVFMGRIGRPQRRARVRSVRRPLAGLLMQPRPSQAASRIDAVASDLTSEPPAVI